MANATNFKSLFRPGIAEFFGTTILAATVFSTVNNYDGFIFAPVALIVAIFMFGWVSGGHFNPAVTIAQMIFKKTSLQAGIFYIVFQMLGGLAGAAFASFILGASLSPLPILTTQNGVGEFVGAMLLSAMVMLVVAKKVSEQAGPFLIGLSLLIAGSMQFQGIFNPAIGFAGQSYSFLHLVLPVLGAVAGASIIVLFIETGKK